MYHETITRDKLWSFCHTISYLNGVYSQEENNNFLRKPLALFCILWYASAIREIIEESSDLLQSGFGHCQLSKAAKNLGAASQMRPEGHLDQQCSILWCQFFLFSVVASLGKSLPNIHILKSASIPINNLTHTKRSVATNTEWILKLAGQSYYRALETRKHNFFNASY